MWNFIYLILVTITVCHGKSNEIKKPPNQFSDNYSAKGTLFIPFAEIKEPFYAWYSKDKNLSRIDYYGGMAKTLQLQNRQLLVKIIPITTEEVMNKESCLTQGDSSTVIQPVIPDITNFEYVGEDMVNGLRCHKWTLTNTFEDKINKYTMWTRVKNSLRQLGDKSAVPVRYEMKGYNTLMGSHYDHYYLDYEWYNAEVPADSVFSIQNYSCPGGTIGREEAIYTFNPMREFVHHVDSHVHEAFEVFKKTHNKVYENEKEHAMRLNLFRQNLRFINSHNRRGRSFTLGVNHLADRTDLEVKVLRGYRPSLKSRSGSDSPIKAQPFPYSREKVQEILKNTPKFVDWRLNGAVTPVKDQSVCGSCWSFGTTGAIEGAYFLKHGKLYRVSQQALVDCSWGFKNLGCDGGNSVPALRWVIKHGIPTEDAYGPYLGQDGYCHANSSLEKLEIQGYVEVLQDADSLMAAIAVHGPTSVALDASHKSFTFYSNGVYYEPDCGNTEFDLDHAVLAVGFGTMNGKDYWLIKNSWSTYWGNDGYILMDRSNNNCGVTDDAVYVVP